ncbi:MAG: primosomal protein N' [Bacteroidales bacterium]|jgi:primosomal protein N' (replication factor Y)|nr:primosomal protein N' [Bacteroidales bacterium]MCI1786338.1 primosomal protein N' [Bacteroidales bacterium]
MPNHTYIKVILPLRLDWEPFYCVSGQQIKTGDKVKVLFSGRSYTGIVSSVNEVPDTDINKIRQVTSVEKDLQPVSENEIKLWKEVAGYYMCGIGEVSKAAYPSGKLASEKSMADAIRKQNERRLKTILALDKKISDIKIRIEKKEDYLGRARKESVKERYIKEIERLKESAEQYAEQRSALVGKEAPAEERKEPAFKRIDLSEAQKQVCSDIEKTFAENKTALLNGITGSGKTEIYMYLAQKILAQKKNVLYMVPEITLSGQLECRLRSVFGNMLHIFHSGETFAERRGTEEAVRKGPYIVLGTRSSVFLPHHDLGLVIIDEEHDASYKQSEPAPRYNGRDTAIMLSKIHGCPVLLGSATPSAESIYNCAVGKYREIKLEERYYGSQEPQTIIIDTSAEKRKNGMSGNFSRKLVQLINETLDNKKQVMILRARRAYSPVLQCEECGEIVKCPHCNVPLSYHKSENGPGLLKCHYCGFVTNPETGCVKCGGKLTPAGAGTQKIEEEARSLFPDAVIARLDSDISNYKNSGKRIIEDFAEGKIDMLIGTQMITKGLDFPGLALVAILQADSLMGQTDFRADEKAFQILEQFKGRSGRRDSKGIFVIQTKQPQHPIYASIADKKQTSIFIDRIMEERKTFGYPPYGRQILIIIKDDNKARLEKLSSQCADVLSKIRGTVTGPYPPAIDKIADKYIRHIRITVPKNNELCNTKKEIAGKIRLFIKEKKYDGHIVIDVDPL